MINSVARNTGASKYPNRYLYLYVSIIPELASTKKAGEAYKIFEATS